MFCDRLDVAKLLGEAVKQVRRQEQVHLPAQRRDEIRSSRYVWSRGSSNEAAAQKARFNRGAWARSRWLTPGRSRTWLSDCRTTAAEPKPFRQWAAADSATSATGITFVRGCGHICSSGSHEEGPHTAFDCPEISPHAAPTLSVK